MNDFFEGDIVRPLGFVTLYFGYAEREVDKLIESLAVLAPNDVSTQKWPVGEKLRHARSLIDKFDSRKLGDLRRALDEAETLFKRRNSLVHSCIYAGGRVESSRSSIGEFVVTPDELMELSERIFACKECIDRARQIDLEPLLKEPRSAEF